MAVTATRVTVATTATLIASGPTATGSSSDDYLTRSFVVKNMSGAPEAIFLGGDSSVTTAGPASWQWDANDGPVSVDLEPGETLYGIVATGTQTLHVLRQGR